MLVVDLGELSQNAQSRLEVVGVEAARCGWRIGLGGHMRLYVRLDRGRRVAARGRLIEMTQMAGCSAHPAAICVISVQLRGYAGHTPMISAITSTVTSSCVTFSTVSCHGRLSNWSWVTKRAAVNPAQRISVVSSAFTKKLPP